MAFLEWSEDLSVGFAQIDDDHKKLITLVNDLADALAEGHASEAVEDVLENLLDYTAWHFRHEERLMQTYGYPGYLAHKTQHEELAQAAGDLHAKFLDGDPGVAEELLPFLKEWLTGHILGTDKETGRFLAEAAG